MKGSEVIVKCLQQQGVQDIFGITGGAVIPLYDALYDHQDTIRNIICRHEQGAAHMAAGFARASGKPGVCVGTSGPGGSNMITGIMDAFMDSTPMVAMAGQVPVSFIGKDAFQETDMIGLTMPITKHNFQVRDPEKLAETLVKAFKLSTEGRPGPIYIDLPKDVQNATVKGSIPKDVTIPSYRPRVKPNLYQIKKAVTALLKAERPLIIAGGGCIIAGAKDALAAFVNASHIPVNTTTMGKGIFNEAHPLALGVMGMHGTEEANYAAVHTDCMLAIGCRFSDRITGDTSLFAQGAIVIHADIDPSEIGKNVRVDIPVVGDAAETIKLLTQVFLEEKGKDKHKGSAWVKALEELRQIGESHKARDVKGMTQSNMITQLGRFLKQEDIVTTGVGQHQMFGEHYLRRTLPRTWITSGGAGTMGYGLPAAIGAKVAVPDREVYDLDGDGSFQMTSQELATAKQFGIKVTPVLMNNQYLGMVKQWLDLFQERRHSGIHFSVNPDFVKLAEAYHLSGISVTRESELVPALQQARKADETVLIDVHVDPEDNIFPMLPPGKGLQHIIGGKAYFTKTWDEVRQGK